MIGRLLSHYRIAEKLGEGGMGVVYRARDERLGRDVALKILTPEIGDEAPSRSRIRREARALARLNHPGICAVYDIDSQDGCDFLVMEHITGGTLADRIARGPVMEHDVIAMAVEIAEALAAAHEENVIHNDLKPENVLVTTKGTLKVSDFGLAKRLPRTPGGVTTATTAAAPALAGTLPYMAPEVLLGQDPSPRSDLYSLGVIVHETMAGQRPFGGETVPELMARILTEPPPPLRSVRPESSAGLEAIVLRCLEKDPERRPGSAVELMEALRRQASEAGSHGQADATRPAMTRSLPTGTTSFVGRVRELRACRELLQGARFLTLLGSGGSGKTRLALQLGAGLEGTFPGGVWFVDFAPVTDPLRVPVVVAAALGIPDGGGREPAAAIVDHLKSRSSLVVMDNCEELVRPIAELIGPLLASRSETRVLATSRVPLRVEGEHLFHVPPLGVPDATSGDTVEAVRESEAGRLFIERAAVVKPGFALTEANARAVAAICRGLDGIPLALELAAGRLKVLSPEQIHDRLDQRFRLLARPVETTTQRHRTLLDTLAWSYEALDEDLQAVLRNLSVFVGGCTLQAAVRVLGEEADEYRLMDQLSELIDMSLLTAGGGEAEEIRYRMLETVRQFARERLPASGAIDAVRDRHLRYFLALAEEANPRLSGPQERLWVERLAADHENLLSAHAWCDRPAGGAELGLRLTWALARFWYIRGEFALGRRELERALARPAAAGAGEFRGRALYGAGDLASFMGDHDAARRHFGEALAVFRDQGDKNWLGRILMGLGNVYLFGEEYTGASQFYEEALEVFRKAGNSRGEALILGNLGELHRQTGDVPKARAQTARALEILRKGEDRHAWALMVNNLSSLSTQLGLLDEASEELLEALTLVGELGARRAGAYTLETAAELAVARKDAWAAVEFYQAAARLREQIGAPLSRVDAAAQRARVDTLRVDLGAGEYQRAVTRGHALSFDEAIARATSWVRGR